LFKTDLLALLNTSQEDRCDQRPAKPAASDQNETAQTQTGCGLARGLCLRRLVLIAARSAGWSQACAFAPVVS
jgi:hypothetical protein